MLSLDDPLFPERYLLIALESNCRPMKGPSFLFFESGFILLKVNDLPKVEQWSYRTYNIHKATAIVQQADCAPR